MTGPGSIADVVFPETAGNRVEVRNGIAALIAIRSLDDDAFRVDNVRKSTFRPVPLSRPAMAASSLPIACGSPDRIASRMAGVFAGRRHTLGVQAQFVQRVFEPPDAPVRLALNLSSVNTPEKR